MNFAAAAQAQTAALAPRRASARSAARRSVGVVRASAQTDRVDKSSKSSIVVSPSILSANFAKLGEEVRRLGARRREGVRGRTQRAGQGAKGGRAFSFRLIPSGGLRRACFSRARAAASSPGSAPGRVGGAGWPRARRARARRVGCGASCCEPPVSEGGRRERMRAGSGRGPKAIWQGGPMQPCIFVRQSAAVCAGTGALPSPSAKQQAKGGKEAVATKRVCPHTK